MNSPVKIWRNQKHIAKMVGKGGKIISWTTVRVPPGGFSCLAPYPVVLVELTDKTKIAAQLVDAQEKDLSFGRQVKVVIRRVTEPSNEGIIPYGIKVKAI